MSIEARFQIFVAGAAKEKPRIVHLFSYKCMYYSFLLEKIAHRAVFNQCINDLTFGWPVVCFCFFNDDKSKYLCPILIRLVSRNSCIYVLSTSLPVVSHSRVSYVQNGSRLIYVCFMPHHYLWHYQFFCRFP